MNLKSVFLLVSISFLGLTKCFAQNDGNALLININYGLHTPQGDLQERFGNNLTAALSVEYMLGKGNYFFGLNQSVLFGSNVNEDVLSGLRNESGIIFNNNFTASNIELRERGLLMTGYVGKLFGLFEDNRRSGIRLQLGAGLLQHKIRIQDDPNAFVTELTDDRKKGYDRLTNGLALHQFIGYQHLAKNRLANFYAGFEFVEAFTQNRREINVDTGMKDDTERLDILAGFKIGWTLPLYIGESADTIYY